MSRFYDALREAGRSAENHAWTGAPADGDLATDGPQAGVVELDAHPFDTQAPTVNSEQIVASNGGAAGGPAKTLPVNRVNGQAPHDEPTARPKATFLLNFNATAKVLPNCSKSVVLEQYRRLRTNILQKHAANPFRRLMIASPGPEEGKTITAINLALSLAMLQNYRVLLVDADLRRGTIGNYVGAIDQPGLTNVIEGTIGLEDAIMHCAEPAMDVLVSGTSKIAPAELLFYDNVGAHFSRMGELYDLVIVDSPPVNLVTDAQLIASNCDAVLLVARAFSTKRKALEKAMHDLGEVRVIGAVLNGGTRAQVYRRYGGYY
jgi:capsular exopolysaccharide synthesis family protein